jgi:hypothetical protein
MIPRSAPVRASSRFSTGASRMRAAWMMDSPDTPSASETTGPTCRAILSWIFAGSSATELWQARESASRVVSGSASRLVGVPGGTMTSTPSPRSSW